MTAKLHQNLAVEKDLKVVFSKIMTETIGTFTKRLEHFTGFTKIYKPLNEEDSYDADVLSESRTIVTSVQQKMGYFLTHASNLLDCLFQKDLTNRQAKADIIVDGVVIASDIPATTLLNLEDWLRQIREVANAEPTLQPGINWVLDPSMGEHIYRTENPDTKTRTKKVTVHNVVVKPTDKHPAQVVSEVQDVVIGLYTETRYAGLPTVAEKSKLLDRIDKLSRAVKQARARANEEPLVTSTLADKLIKYLVE